MLQEGDVVGASSQRQRGRGYGGRILGRRLGGWTTFEILIKIIINNKTLMRNV